MTIYNANLVTNLFGFSHFKNIKFSHSNHNRFFRHFRQKRKYRSCVIQNLNVEVLHSLFKKKENYKKNKYDTFLSKTWQNLSLNYTICIYILMISHLIYNIVA